MEDCFLLLSYLHICPVSINTCICEALWLHAKAHMVTETNSAKTMVLANIEMETFVHILGRSIMTNSFPSSGLEYRHLNLSCVRFPFYLSISAFYLLFPCK